VLAPTNEENLGAGAMAVRLTDWGLIVAQRMSDVSAVPAVAAVDQADPPPEGEDIFTGELGGITFYSGIGYDVERPCSYGLLGFGDPDAEVITEPEDERLNIEPGYLPANVVQTGEVIGHRCGDVEIIETSYIYLDGNAQFTMIRRSGDPEWISIYSREWFTETEVAGLPAVILQSPAGISEESPTATVYVREEFGVLVVVGPDVDEVVRIAEGLNR